MNASSDLQVIADRLARATSVIRVRASDATRLESNGGTPAELALRVEAVVADLEKAARRLTTVLT